MLHMCDVPTDVTEHQIVLIKNNKKKGSTKNIFKYTKVSDCANTKFDMIADILHKDEHKVQRANSLDTAIKPLLEEMLKMPKKMFCILPKSDGFKNNLHFGEDYKLHYNAERLQNL
eukprot:4952781-Ditylum_brightwellii.AAC.1